MTAGITDLSADAVPCSRASVLSSSCCLSRAFFREPASDVLFCTCGLVADCCDHRSLYRFSGQGRACGDAAPPCRPVRLHRRRHAVSCDQRDGRVLCTGSGCGTAIVAPARLWQAAARAKLLAVDASRLGYTGSGQGCRTSHGSGGGIWRPQSSRDQDCRDLCCPSARRPRPLSPVSGMTGPTFSVRRMSLRNRKR